MIRLVFVLELIFMLSSCATHRLATKKIVDLTHDFGQQTIYWPTEAGFKHETEHFGPTEKGYFYSSYRFSCAEHGGTHIDAPIHFSDQGQTVDNIPLTNLVGSAVVVDISTASLNRDYLITVDDLKNWEAKHKESLFEKIVLLKTGFAQYWPDRIKYLGTDKKGPEAVKEFHFPGLDPDAATWLATKRQIKAVGIDTASIDYGQSTLYGAHPNQCSSL